MPALKADRVTRTRRATRAIRFTRRGVTILVVGIVSMVTAYSASSPELLYLAVLALLLPVSAAAFVRFRRITVEVSRSFSPDIVAVDQPTTVELTVANAMPYATPELVWRDRLPWRSVSLVEGTMGSLTPRRSRLLTAGNVRKLRYEINPPRRGVFSVGPMAVVLSDPFGLAYGEVKVGAVDRLVVTPALAVLPETGLSILASEGTSMLVNRAIGGEDDLSTREYRRGDALRRVHWRATARHGELMVRQEEPRSHAEARVILDTRRVGYGDTNMIRGRDDPESESFEAAVSLAATIALHLNRSGFEVEFVETGHPQLAPVTPLAPFLESLATVELSPASGEYRPDSALHASARLDQTQGSVFAVIADADHATVDRLVSQRHTFTLAVVFVITWRESDQIERLRMAGWTCVMMNAEDPAESAWRAIGEVHGDGSNDR